MEVFLAVFDIKVVYSLVILQLIHFMNYCNLYVVIPGAVIQLISRRIDMHIILILWIFEKFIFLVLKILKYQESLYCWYRISMLYCNVLYVSMPCYRSSSPN